MSAQELCMGATTQDELANCLCQFDWTTGCPDTWLDVTPVCVYTGASD